MNKTVQKMWTRALRSKKYKQGTYSLCAFDRATKQRLYCPLGVLCHLASLRGVCKEEPYIFMGTLKYFLYDQTSTLLPTSVLKWAGLNNEDEYVQIKFKNGNITDIATLNDNRNLKLATIANVIERYL
jgi:hypothetical protein